METAAAISPLPDAAPTQVQRFPVRFVGSGSEYFRIWIVNLLLTLVTLGIYSPWAKVRRLQYLYRNTQVAGSSFDYHGNPVAILKGRLIAGVLLIAYNLSFELSLAAGAVVLIVLLAISPWLLRQALRFRLRNSSWRAIRFRFDGSLAEACWIVLPVIVLTAPFFMMSAFGRGKGAEPPGWFLALFFTALALYAGIVPYLHCRLKRYQHGHSHLGSADGRFTGTVGSFYAVYAVTGLLLAVAAAVAGGVFALTAAIGGQANVAGMGFLIVPLVFYALFIFVLAAFVAMLQNRVWNRSALGDLTFESRARIMALARIYVVNVLGILFTLGLFTPFAVIRSLKYRLEALTVHSRSGVDNFVAVASNEEVDATGEGAVDMFDIDLGL